MLCVVTTCETKAEAGFRTCSDTDHRKVEEYNALQSKAMFQLKRRLERAKITQTHDSLSSGEPVDPDLEEDGEDLLAGGEEDVLVDKDGTCEEKSDTGNFSVRARFGRRHTHNEELCVASCGVILGRATFYGSEAPNGVRVSLLVYFCQLVLKAQLDVLDAPFSNKGVTSRSSLARQQLSDTFNAEQ